MKKHPFFYRKGRFLMKCKDSRTIYHRWTWTVQGSDRTKYRDATNSLTPRDSDFMPIKYILRKSCDLMTESKMTIGKFRGNLYRNVHNSLKLNTVTAMAKGVVSDPKFTNYPSPSNPVSNFHPFLLGHHPHTPPPPPSGEFLQHFTLLERVFYKISPTFHIKTWISWTIFGTPVLKQRLMGRK